MEIFRDLSLLWSLFHILILFMLLYRSRYSVRKTFLLTGLTMGPLILLNIAGVAVYGTAVMGKIFIFTCTLPSLLFFWFVSKDKKGRFFFTFCLADTVALWIIAVTNLADFYVGGGQYILMFIGRLLLFPLLEWAAVKRLRKPYLELQGGGSKRLGDRCRNDSALLYTACRNGGLSGSHNAKAAGTPGVYFNIGIDADDLRYYFYGAL